MKAVFVPCHGATATRIVTLLPGTQDPGLPTAPPSLLHSSSASNIQQISLLAATSVGSGIAIGARRSRRPQRSSCRSQPRIVQRAQADEKNLASGESGLPVAQTARSPTADPKIGVVLMNIGTPDSTEVEDVREYLARFLGDDRVLEIPQPFKFVLLQLLLGTRPQKSAENYKSIWDPERGSPLKFHTEDLVAALQEALGDTYVVRMCFQYSAPFTADVVRDFGKMAVDEIMLVPMFPQYASGTTGTCLSVAYETAAQMFCTPYFTAVPSFYNESPFLDAQAALIEDVIGPNGEKVDHTLFSFHGLPIDQCSKAHVDGATCDATCAKQLTVENRNCYHAQCYETARWLALKLGLDNNQWSVAFQSRLTLRGTIEWIKPYTDEVFANLAKDGVRRLAVAAPSFTIDCVETLEELSITGREQFEEAGGEELLVVPCVNASPHWVSGLAQLVHTYTKMGVTKKPLTFGDVCPISGKQGVWRKERHPIDVMAEATPTSKAVEGIGG